MVTLMETMAQIRERPSMMLGGRPSVNNLYMFLWGFAYARKDDGLGDFDLMAGFGRHVHHRYRISSTQSWAQIIQFYSLTEDDEMQLFWKLWDEFIAKSASKRKKVS
jgi:hypothetical protein